MSTDAQDRHENSRRFMAAVLMTLANLGSTEMMWEFIAQNIASMLEGSISDAPMLAGIFSDITSRVADLLNGGKIWDELVPGPVRDEPDWDVLMGYLDMLMQDPPRDKHGHRYRFQDIKVERVVSSPVAGQEGAGVEVYGKNMLGQDVWILLQGVREYTAKGGSMIGPMIDEVASNGRHENIRLDYTLILRRMDNEGDMVSMFADGCEFFLDEHGFQWVKFTPSNGHHPRQEHMWRLDGSASPCFEVIRDDA